MSQSFQLKAGVSLGPSLGHIASGLADEVGCSEGYYSRDQCIICAAAYKGWPPLPQAGKDAPSFPETATV